MSEFKHDLIDIDENGDIIVIGQKDIYNTDGHKTLSDWTREPIKGLKTFDEPNMCSGIVVRKDGADNRGMNVEGNIGYFYNAGTDVYHSTQSVGIFTSAFGNGHGHGILPSNFLRVCSAFSARKLIDNDWINHFDEYLAPNENHGKYHEFEMDSVIYSLFNSKSQQSSLRHIQYHDKDWNIKNHFFFMSNEEMKNLANENNNDEVYNDAMNDNEDRFVYKFIEEHKSEFSKEALEVLEKAKDLVRKSFKYRPFFNDNNPDYQINNWDCGWYQVKAVLKEYMPNDLKEFREVYKRFSEKMKPMVYELGFLRK